MGETAKKQKKKGNVRFAPVRERDESEREELFDIGEDSSDGEDEDGYSRRELREDERREAQNPGRMQEQPRKAVLSSSSTA